MWRKLKIIVTIFLIAPSVTRFAVAPALGDALTDEQRLEIEKLRSELSDALQKHEEQELTEQSVIVQPKWLRDPAAAKEELIKSKVELTEENKKEVHAMREEIAEAVKQDLYVDSTVGSAKLVKQLEQELQTNGSSRESPTVAAIANEVSDSGKDELNLDSYMPNIVDASGFIEPDIDVRKLQALELSKRRTREMLILKSITEDYSFGFGIDVQQWAQLYHNGQQYFIGRRMMDLLIVRKTVENGWQESGTLQLDATIGQLQTYSYWNKQQQQQEGVIMATTDDKLLWYRGDNQTGEIMQYWQWHTGGYINAFSYFSHESQQYVAICSNSSNALNLYQFVLDSREFWIIQRLQLPVACWEINFLNTGRDLLLAVPVNNTAHIYVHNSHAGTHDYLHFELQHRIESEQISSIAAFQMGARSYLALGGLQPQILLYQQAELLPKTILGNNFGLVELFFPIPVRTYRDDLLLLIQHSVDFGSHTLTVLETLIWNGDAFVASVPAPCQLGSYISSGVSCMLDLQRDAGLKGASLMRRGNETLLLVPRNQAVSGLFQLHTELLAKNSELLDLQQIFEFMQQWVKEQDELITQAQLFLAMPEDERSDITQQQLGQLELLVTPQLTLHNATVDEIFINDYKWTKQDEQLQLSELLQRIEELGEAVYGTTAAREKRQAAVEELEEQPIYFEELTLQDLHVQQLTLQKQNDVQFYVQNSQLNFDGELHFKQGLQVLQPQSQQQLSLVGNLQFDKLNGVSWQQLLNNLVLRNESSQLTQLKVQGKMVLENLLSVDVLNSLNFPQDFLWASGPRTSTVKAPKYFTGNLTANAVDTDGLINGVNPLDAITLTDTQDWTGTPTFSQLTVTEKFELNGTARARGFEDFPTNPTLGESNTINANCEFEQLEVSGAIVINEKLQINELTAVLSQLVQTPLDTAEQINITSSKNFVSSLILPTDFELLDNAINNVPIEEFVSADSAQQLSLNTINGNVYFHNLNVSGTYDGVDILEIVKNGININEPFEEEAANMDTQLNFANIVLAKDVQILKSLNSMPIEQAYQTVHEDLHLDVAHFVSIKAKQADVNSDITGNANVLFNGMKLQELLSDNNKTLYKNVYVQELQLLQQLEAKQIYGIDSHYMLDFLNQIDDLPEMILDGKIQLDHIAVLGDVQVSKLNGYNFDDDLQLSVIWLHRPNYLGTSLKFMETVHVHGNLNVESRYNGLDLPQTLNDLIFRSQEPQLHIWGAKRFLQTIHVLGNTQAEYVNELPMQFIVNKVQPAQFNGSLTLNGNLYVQQLQLHGTLNDFQMSKLPQMLHYETELQQFVLQGTAHFSTQLQLRDLTVLGDLNEHKQLTQFLQNLVYKRSNTVSLSGTNNFTGRVSIMQAASIDYLNGHNLKELFSNMVFIDEPQEVSIETALRFKSAVNAAQLYSTGSLSSSNICGCDLKFWLNDTLRLDRPLNIHRSLTFAAHSLHNNAFNVQLLNNIEMSKLITLQTPQNLSFSSLLFSNAYLDNEIQTRGLVNAHKLQMAFANTLLSYGNQHLSTALLLQTATVLGDLHINGSVNEQLNFNELATLQEPNLQLNSALYFQDIYANQVLLHQAISGIDFNMWQRQALWLNARAEQRITGNWSVNSLTVHMGPELPEYMLQQVNSKRAINANNSVLAACDDLMQNTKIGTAFELKHLQFYERLLMPEQMLQAKIDRVFALNGAKQHYLLINLGCQSLLYQWPWHTRTYQQKPQTYETGHIEQLETAELQNGKQILLTNGRKANCSYSGLNSWSLHLNSGVLKHLQTFPQTPHAMQVRTDKTALPMQTLLYVANDKLVQSIRLSNGSIMHSWNISAHASDSRQPYQFVRNDSSASIMLSNGEHVLLLHQKSSKPRLKRLTAVGQLLLPSAQLLGSATQHAIQFKTTLNATQRLTLQDIKHDLETMLLDLSERLSIEMNITQLSIPETDLYDEHLIPDFLAIMHELQQQQIFSNGSFAHFNLTQMQLPQNPAQVLAARAIQIIWSTLTEVTELHNHLRIADKEQPFCACIANSLANAMHDMLVLAFENVEIESASAFNRIIERIRQLQAELVIMLQELSTLQPALGEVHNNTQVQTSQCCVNEQRVELLTLSIGSCLKPRTLIALTSPLRNYTDVRLYMNMLNNTLYQLINAQQPARALVTMRIGSETLLAFVEGCCTVQIYIYRGIQGFVRYHSFNTEQPIVQLLTLSLPGSTHNHAVQLHLMAVVFQHNIELYRFVVTGQAQCA